MVFTKRERQYLEELSRHQKDDFKEIMSDGKLKYILRSDTVFYKKFKSVSYRRILKFRTKERVSQMKKEKQQIEKDLELYNKVKHYLI